MQTWARAGAAVAALGVAALAQAADPRSLDVDLGRGAGRLTYFVSDTSLGATAALIIQHGYGRDAQHSLAAGDSATQGAGRAGSTIVVAPLFQVGEPASRHCGGKDTPPPRAGDALWTCASWNEGGESQGGGMTSFAAYDRLLADLLRRWPKLQTVTIAGFSAGGQFVQRYAAFARPPAALKVRYVVADPGTFLYFDPVRPQPRADWASCVTDSTCDFTWRTLDAEARAACPQANTWKHGTDHLPASLGATAAQARARYAAADVAYVEGALDTGNGPGTFFNLLEKTCAARLEGPFRLQRGLGYAAYDRKYLAPDKQRTVTVVPGCAHDVRCVVPSPAARAVLFP